MKTMFNFTLVLLFTFLASAMVGQTVQTVEPSGVEKMVKNGAIFVDVREPSELKELAYNVEGAKNIPLSQFRERMGEMPKDKKIILACRSGARSMRAAKMLIANGYTHVYNMNGGIIAWQQQGQPVLKNGEKPKVKKASCCSKKAKKTKSCCSKKKE